MEYVNALHDAIISLDIALAVLGVALFAIWAAIHHKSGR